MKHSIFRTMLAIGLCAGLRVDTECFHSAAVAAEAASPQSDSSPAQQKSASPPVPSATAKTETPAVLVDDSHLESILGKEVHTASGEVLGNITDVLVEGDGSLRAAVVDLGGFLGVGVRKIAVAWTALHFVQEKTGLSVALDMSKDQLRVAPELRAGEPIVIVGAKPKSAEPPSSPPEH